MTQLIGVDVSSYQPSNYSTAGLSFAIVKATEYTSYVNPEYAAQVATARDAGLLVGHYHFARSTDSAAEAAYFAAHASVQPGDLIALDWEVSTVTPAARDTWLRDVKARFPHNRVVLYCDVNYWDTLDTEHYAADGLWIADYSNPAGHPNVAQPWVIHQYSSAGGIDHNIAVFGTIAEMRAWADGLDAPVPTPIEEDDWMTVTSANGRAGLAWPTGKYHAIGVNYDPANGVPKIRLVLALHTGPFVAAENWEPQHGCDALEIPVQFVANCQGVILEGASNGPVFDVTAA